MDGRVVSALAAQAWAARQKLNPLALERPDEAERREPAVDLLGRDEQGRPRLVLEHTLVESFLDQRTVQIAAIRMFAPLEQQLNTRLPSPGHYTLTITPGAVLGLKQEAKRIRACVAHWVQETAPTLAIGRPNTAPRHFATITIPDTKLEVSLYRWPHRDGEFQLVFDAPGQSSDTLTPPMARALAAKCPKLAAAKGASKGVESLLLLEIHDIQLGNLFDLDAVVQASLRVTTWPPPDHIWLVDTTDDPLSVMISKEGARLGGSVLERYLPFHLRDRDPRHG
jgi:hypothetical protein